MSDSTFFGPCKDRVSGRQVDTAAQGTYASDLGEGAVVGDGRSGRRETTRSAVLVLVEDRAVGRRGADRARVGVAGGADGAGQARARARHATVGGCEAAADSRGVEDSALDAAGVRRERNATAARVARRSVGGVGDRGLRQAGGHRVNLERS